VCPYSASRGEGELGKAGGEALIAMLPFPGEPWSAKNGSDLVHSLVYWFAVVRVAPRADKRGEVVALYGPFEAAEGCRLALPGAFALQVRQS
jgi:hypothetical protein